MVPVWLPIETYDKQIENGSVWCNVVYGQPYVAREPAKVPATFPVAQFDDS